MAKKTTKKQESISPVDKVKRHENDNGSPEVQIVQLTEEIKILQDHLAQHIHDVDPKRSLLKKVAKRRTLLKYLKENDIKRYTVIAQELNLKA
jgi:small subunit ribosomal protein S15